MPEPTPGARVGLFGGSFDPVHIGHLVLAEEARFRLGLDRVVFVPAEQPPHKRGRILTAADHRLRMAAIATSANPAFSVSRLDLDRPGPHYSVDLVRLFLARETPGTEVFFLMGADSLEELTSWRDPSGLLERCQVAALSRPGHTPDLHALAQTLPAALSRVVVLEMPLIGVSASDIRARVRRQETIRYQVPDGVWDYILAHRLYLEEEQPVPGGAGR